VGEGWARGGRETCCRPERPTGFDRTGRIDPDALVTSLRAALPSWLATQRWYGGGGSAPTSVDILHVDPLDDSFPMLVWCPIETTASDGTVATYQMLLGLDVSCPEDLTPEVLTTVRSDVDTGDLSVYPALADPRLRLALAHHVAPSIKVRRAVQLGGDFSNSSIVYDDAWLLKVFRRLDAGPNPDAEVPVGLGRVGYEDVTPVPVGVWTRDGWDLAVMRRYLTDATDGQAVLAATLTECLERRLPPDRCPTDVQPLASSLGATVGRMHLGLAEAFGQEPMTGDDLASLLIGRLDAATDMDIDVAGIEDTYRQLATADDLGASMRVHGDLHLGQCLHGHGLHGHDLHGHGGWQVMDFEGEPLRPLAERRLPSSPLRDVAGVVRSIGYVTELGLLEAAVDRDALDGDLDDRDLDDGDLVVLAEAWEQRAVDGFIAGYSAVGGIDALLPRSARSRDAILRIFELDKALYEISYETAHRPRLAEIPRRAVVRLTTADHHRRW
jgi:maltokinase